MRLHQYIVHVTIKRKNGRTEFSAIRAARNALDAIMYVLANEHTDAGVPLLATAKPY